MDIRLTLKMPISITTELKVQNIPFTNGIT